MSWWKWSRTAASNASADGTINWAEGQAPSSVNDSARAMMTALAKARGDLSGSITTGGTSTAYTLTSYQVFTALQAELFVAFTPHATNGATVTLNVDGLGAKPLRSQPGSSGEIGAGVLIQGTPYVATYFTSNGGEWILQGFYGNAFNIPVAGCMDYFGTTAPNSNFVFPFGQAISRTTYAGLFALLGTTFGTGDGSTTFNVPDLRGRVTAGKDNMGGSAASRIGSVATDSGTIVGTTLGSVGGSSTHVLTTSEMPTHAHGSSGGINSAPSLGALPSAGAVSISAGVGGSGYIASTNVSPLLPDHTQATAGSQGGSAAHAMLQPTMIVNKILRII